MYHYYIHGVNGNVSSTPKNVKIPKIDIQVRLTFSSYADCNDFYFYVS